MLIVDCGSYYSAVQCSPGVFPVSVYNIGSGVVWSGVGMMGQHRWTLCQCEAPHSTPPPKTCWLPIPGTAARAALPRHHSPRSHRGGEQGISRGSDSAWAWEIWPLPFSRTFWQKWSLIMEIIYCAIILLRDPGNTPRKVKYIQRRFSSSVKVLTGPTTETFVKNISTLVKVTL